MTRTIHINKKNLKAAILFAGSGGCRIPTEGVLIKRDGTLVATNGHTLVIFQGARSAAPPLRSQPEIDKEAALKPWRISRADAEWLLKSTPDATQDEPHLGLYLDADPGDITPGIPFIINLPGKRTRHVRVEAVEGEFAAYHTVLPADDEQPVFRFCLNPKYLQDVAAAASALAVSTLVLEFFSGSGCGSPDMRPMLFSAGDKDWKVSGGPFLRGLVMPMSLRDGRKDGLLAKDASGILRAKAGIAGDKAHVLANELDSTTMFAFKGKRKADLVRRLRLLAGDCIADAVQEAAKKTVVAQ